MLSDSSQHSIATKSSYKTPLHEKQKIFHDKTTWNETQSTTATDREMYNDKLDNVIIS